jgi:hypothetical protein
MLLNRNNSSSSFLGITTASTDISSMENPVLQEYNITTGNIRQANNQSCERREIISSLIIAYICENNTARLPHKDLPGIVGIAGSVSKLL